MASGKSEFGLRGTVGSQLVGHQHLWREALLLVVGAGSGSSPAEHWKHLHATKPIESTLAIGTGPPVRRVSTEMSLHVLA
jgi:hypothetical protein